MRWTARRKMELLLAVRAGEAEREQLMRFHDITPEEWASWERLYADDGVRALRTTQLQKYRPLSSYRPKKPK